MHDMVEITVRLLGPAADMVGQTVLQYALTPPARIADLAELIYARYPRLGANAAVLRFAVNDEYAGPECELKGGDEVAILPPVAGGNDDFVQLTREAIDRERVSSLAAVSGSGAVVTFEGVVRPESRSGATLAALEYSAYEAMALKEMERLRLAAMERFSLGQAVIVQRVGRAAVGELAAMIVTAAPHRAAAFDACRWLIEQLKAEVPVWKQEIWSDGGRTWVAGRKSHEESDRT